MEPPKEQKSPRTRNRSVLAKTRPAKKAGTPSIAKSTVKRTPAVATPSVRGASRPPLERMMRLHQQIQAGSFPNCRKLSEQLEVSTKTIQRDIEFMRDRLNLPIEYDQLEFGFYYTEPVTHFPSIEVSEGEVVALFVAQKALEQYRGTSFEKPLQTAFKKISDGLRENISFQWGDVDSAISFRGIGTTIVDLELFEAVSKAVLRCHELEFEYQKLSSPKHETRKVLPYHLGCVENQWYLFGYDQTRKQIRTFALPRIRHVKDTKVKFKRPVDFSIREYLGGSFGVFSGTGKIAITIWFDAFAARLVSERQWHDSQTIKALTRGEIELSMELGSLEEIERWILSWGVHARVLEPKALAERIAVTAGSIHSAY